MKLVIFLSGLIIFIQNVAIADTWNLPQQLSTENTEVTFEVDSTWHLVKGVARQISGKLWLEDLNDFHSIRGNIILPVTAFDTDNETRDEKLKKVMHVESVANVTFEFSNSIPSLCSPEMLKEAQSCVFEVLGNLSINGVTRNTVLKSQLTLLNSTYKISGTTTIKWADFKVDNPSIFVAKLYDEVKINFLVNLNPKS